MRITRREFGGLTGGAFASFACNAAAADDGPLAARPRAGGTTSAKSGRLGLESGRDAILQLPASTASPLPLLVLLHGASGGAEGILRRVGAAADEAGVVVLAPDSRDGTWDAIRGGFGPD